MASEGPLTQSGRQKRRTGEAPKKGGRPERVAGRVSRHTTHIIVYCIIL